MNSIYNVFDSNIWNVTLHLDYYQVHLKSLSEVRSSGMILTISNYLLSLRMYIIVVDDETLYFCIYITFLPRKQEIFIHYYAGSYNTNNKICSINNKLHILIVIYFHYLGFSTDDYVISYNNY